MKRFKRILCVVEPRQTAETVLERADSLAQNNQANLTVVSVAPRVTAGIRMPDGEPISLKLQKAAIADSRQQLENAVAPFQLQITNDVKVLMGTAFLEIIREVLRHGHDLVIKAPEDPAWPTRYLARHSRAWVGITRTGLLDLCSTPSLMLPTKS